MSGNAPQMLEERDLAAISKNKAEQIRVTFKKIRVMDRVQDFIDIRIEYFRNGASEPPQPTGKGVMVPYAERRTLALALLTENVGETWQERDLNTLQTLVCKVCEKDKTRARAMAIILQDVADERTT